MSHKEGAVFKVDFALLYSLSSSAWGCQEHFARGPAVSLACVYCQARRAITDRGRSDDTGAEYSGKVHHDSHEFCCSPSDEDHCPHCNSQDLQFALRSCFDFDGTQEWEEARCDTCGWTGNAEEVAPPKEPWRELEAVAALIAAPPSEAPFQAEPASTLPTLIEPAHIEFAVHNYQGEPL